MRYEGLPDDVTPRGSSPVFTWDTLPEALCSEHALAPKRWGVLQILEGSVIYVDLTDGHEREISAPEHVMIAPERPHKLRRLGRDLRCRIDFFQDTATL